MVNTLFPYLFLLIANSLAADCIWDASMWKQNCFQYCFYKYDKAPQRGYYNQTSQNCQPIRRCGYRLPPQKAYYYNYDLNRCFQSKTNLTEVHSFRPLTLRSYMFIEVGGQNMICMHGRVVKIYSATDSRFICQCESMWQDSGKYDMNGVPFKCDTPITDPVGYFVGSIEYDAEGNRIKLGNYTPLQISVALQNMKATQKKETRQYILRHQQSIFYAIDQAFKSSGQSPQSLTSVSVYFFVFFYIVILISYIEERLSIIYITKQQMLQKIKQAIQQQIFPLKQITKN